MKKNSLTNDKKTDFEQVTVADGGIYAWTVCLCTVVTFGFYLGFEFNYGLIDSKFIRLYNGTSDNVLYSTWIGSTAFGLECLFFLPSAVLIDLFGSRTIAIFGALLSTLGLFGSAFVQSLPIYLLTYGIFFGIGQAFLAESTFQILPHYFDKNLGLVNGIMNFGGSAITVAVIYASGAALDLLTVQDSFFVYAGLSVLTILAAATFKSVLRSKSHEELTFKSKIKESFGVEVLKRPAFIVWSISACLALFGFTITNITIDHHAETLYPDSNPILLNVIYATCSGVSGLLFGFLLDYCVSVFIFKLGSKYTRKP
jgi:MFS family permease